MLLTSAPASASYYFTDVAPGHKFHTEIMWLAGQEITTGYADGTFKPRDSVSREAFAAFLYRLAGKPAVTLPSKSPFKDVKKSAQFYKEIVWLSQQGITNGWSDGTFRPKNNISREAVSAFLYRFEGRPSFSPPSKSPFKDIKKNSQFYKEVTWLSQTGMTGGYADNTFRPKNNVSREAIAAFLYRGHGTFRIGDYVEFAGMGLTVKSASLVNQITTREGPTIFPASGEGLVSLRTQFTELSRSGTDLSCGGPWGAYIQMWDNKGQEIQPIFETHRIPGNPPCNHWLLTGQKHDWNTAWRVTQGHKPYALTIMETDRYSGYVVIYFDSKGPTIVP